MDSELSTSRNEAATANQPRIAMGDKADRRWNEAWNGRPDYKRFRRSMRAPRAPFVGLVEHIVYPRDVRPSRE